MQNRQQPFYDDMQNRQQPIYDDMQNRQQPIYEMQRQRPIYEMQNRQQLIYEMQRQRQRHPPHEADYEPYHATRPYNNGQQRAFSGHNKFGGKNRVGNEDKTDREEGELQILNKPPEREEDLKKKEDDLFEGGDGRDDIDFVNMFEK